MQILQPRRRQVVFILGVLILPLLFSACTSNTPYQRIGNRKEGGYSFVRHSKDTYSVTYQGAEYSKPEQIYDYALLRSAELTVESGYKYFVVNSDNDRSRNSTRYTPGSPGFRTMEHGITSTGRTYTYSSYTPGFSGSVSTVRVPIYTLMIKMYPAKEGIQAPENYIYEAAPLIIQLKAKHQLK
ncbi:MAG: hypothetical protein QM715_00035 [Nibricoccus sp.]